MLHRAILGSFERFIGILIEHYEGNFPLWLSPIQLRVMSITDRNRNYCLELENIFKEHNIRVDSDVRNEKIGLKIREGTLEKIPYMIIIGDNEEKSKKLSIRKKDGTEFDIEKIDEFINILNEEILLKGVKKINKVSTK